MVVAVKEADKIVVGVTACDSIIDSSVGDLALQENIPLWRVAGEKGCYVVADDLDFSVDLLRFNEYVFKGITDAESITQNVVPKMKEVLSAFGQLVEDKKWRNQLIIIKEDKLFSVDRYFTVNEIDESVAHGYESYARGALEACVGQEAKERILFAMRHTQKMNNKILFPLMIFDTKSKRREIFYQ